MIVGSAVAELVREEKAAGNPSNPVVRCVSGTYALPLHSSCVLHCSLLQTCKHLINAKLKFVYHTAFKPSSLLLSIRSSETFPLIMTLHVFLEEGILEQ